MRTPTIKAPKEKVIKESISHSFHHVWIDTGKRNKKGKKVYKSIRTGELKAFPEEE